MADKKSPNSHLSFSDKAVSNLKPSMDKKERDYLFSGRKGFGVRVRPSGAKVFYYKYRFDGRLRFMNLGTYPHTSLADANQKYGDAYKLRKNGLDPLEVAKEAEKQAQEEQIKSLSVGDLIDDYIEKYAKTHKKSWHKDELVLNSEVRKAWGTRTATSISKLDVTTLLQKIVERGAPGQAQNVLESARKMYNWAIDQGTLETTPFLGVKRPAPKNKKDRVLTEKEIKILWDNLTEANMSDEIKAALKLTLVTAQRPGECVSIHRNEINGHWWTIPGSKTKNGKPHRVYLTDFALELIGPLEIINPKTGETSSKGFIFPCPHKKKIQPIGEGAMGQALRDNFELDKINIGKFTPHDLRRTAVTHLARIKTPREWRERILNHLPKELDATYNLYEYDEEKELSMKKWEAELWGILLRINSENPQ